MGGLTLCQQQAGAEQQLGREVLRLDCFSKGDFPQSSDSVVEDGQRLHKGHCKGTLPMLRGLASKLYVLSPDVENGF